MKRMIVWILILTLLLCGCQTQPVETTAPTETTQPVVETTLPAPAPTAPETTVPVSEEPIISGLMPGYYLISSVGRDGNVDFYGSLDAENGWLLLNEDGTGTMYFEGTEGELTWSEQELTWQGQTLMGAVMTYYDSELDREDAMLVLYFMDPVVSVIFRPAPAPEEIP